MEAGNLIRNIIEIVFGVIFLIGAAFNTFYTLKHREEFFGSFADNAIIPPFRHLVRKGVIPYARVFTILLILFQLAIAICILSRGVLVRPGLFAGAVFAFAAVLVSNITGALANLAMGAVMVILALNR